MIKDVTDSTVEGVISTGLVLLDVWAPWCQPCKRMHPILEQVASELGDAVTIARINAETDLSFATKLGVKGIPAFFVYNNGTIVFNWVGAKSKEAVISIIKSYM